MEDDKKQSVRSLNNDVSTYCTFINRTGRTVLLFWLDFTGQLVRYGKIAPQKGIRMDTYVTHPWIARDAETMYPLQLNGNYIFYPVAEENGQAFHSNHRHTVTIHIPVYPLLRRCLEVVYQTCQVDAIKNMDIPVQLKQTLLKLVPSAEYRDYKKFNSVWYEDFTQN